MNPYPYPPYDLIMQTQNKHVANWLSPFTKVHTLLIGAVKIIGQNNRPDFCKLGKKLQSVDMYTCNTTLSTCILPLPFQVYIHGEIVPGIAFLAVVICNLCLLNQVHTSFHIICGIKASKFKDIQGVL